MATQRITIAKVGGVAADVVVHRLQEWAAARQTADPHEWAAEQWPAQVRCEVDTFADRVRANALSPPVVHFVEWSDLWSMGDVFPRWLTPPGGPRPLCIHTDRLEVYGYVLPDDGRLERYLAGAGPRQFDEYDSFVRRLHEAIHAWESLVDRAVLVVIREVVGGLATDEELMASLSLVPDWLAAD